MTATYSEERPDKAVLFHLRAATNTTVYAAESDVWESVASEQRQREYLEAQWMTVGVSTPECVAALDTTDCAEIDESACLAKPIEFAHACEAEFARILDTRDISWQYKPRTFAVEWDEEGNFVDCFTPDFYLPPNETYIALIAPGRCESNTKTRNVNLLRRQHPEIRIEIFNMMSAYLS